MDKSYKPVLKQFLIIFLPLLALAIGVIFVFYSLQIDSHRNLMVTDQTRIVNHLAERVTENFDVVLADLQILAYHHELTDHLTNLGGTDSRQQLTADFVTFSEASKIYDQIRLIDEHGQEVIRVNYNNGQPEVVPEHALQNKQDRYYFQNSWRLNQDEVYISPLDLNIEQGKIEQPLKPMIRFGTPVFDDQGRKRGILVLNYFGAELLNDFVRVSQGEPGSLMLVNQDGYWLKGETPAEEWGFMFDDDRRQATLFNRFSAEGTRIFGQQAGQFSSPNGLFTFATIDPLREVQSAIFDVDQPPSGRPWHIISFISEEALLATEGEFRISAVAISLLLTAILGQVCWLLARSRVERRQTQIELQERETTLRAFIDNSPALICMKNSDGQVIEANQTFVETFAPLDQIDEFMAEHPGVAHAVRFNDLLVLETGEPQQGEVEVKLAQETHTLLSTKFPLHDSRGQITGVAGIALDITERKRTSEQLRYLSTAVEQSASSIAISDIQGLIQYVNPKFTEMTGFTAEEAIGQSGTFLKNNEMSPDDYLAFWTALDRGESWQGELLCHQKDGHPYWESAKISPIRDDAGEITHYVAIEEDITEKKLAEEELRVLNQAIEASNNAILIADVRQYDMPLIYVNLAFERITGYSRDEILGQNCRFLQRDDRNQPGLDELRTALKEGQECEVILRNYRKDGTLFWNELKVAPVFDEKGTVTHFVGVSQDVTDRKQAEQDIQQAKEVAVAANQAKSEFLANMSHEIRTPMNGVIGMTELALGTDLTEEQREYLTAVQNSADALLNLINDILDFSKIEAGKLELEEVDFDLRSATENLADIMVQRASGKNLELILDMHPDVPTGVKGDPLRYRQVLINLIGNAIKFTDQGEVVITVETLAETDDDIEIRCSVSDTGIGIAPEKLSLVFESFSQADGSTTRQYGGTGLGLTISQQLVHLMGGNIWVESELGKGATFYFTIHLKRQPDWKERVTPEMVDLQDLRVLIVDDNATNRQILRHTLKNFGCQPVEAENGWFGLQKLQRAANQNTPFDLVLLDYQMPELDGLQVLQQIKDLPALAQLQIIMLTSVDTLQSMTKRQDAGWAAYLTKPVKQSQLLNTMQEVVGSANNRNAAEPRQATLPAPETTPVRQHPAWRILLVEDNKINSRLGIAMLQKAGFQVTHAENGKDALYHLQNGFFDLIFMDIQMPVMDGLEATAIIKANPRWSDIPVVAMTAHAMTGDREKFLAAGLDDYMTKPIRMDQIMAALERQLVPVGESNGRDTSPAKAKDETQAKEAELPVLDMAGAIDRLGLDEEDYNELLELYLEMLDARVSEIAKTVAQAQAQQLKEAAHSLKGASANMGIERIRAAASELEEIGGGGNLEQAKTALDALHQEAERLRRHVAVSQ